MRWNHSPYSFSPPFSLSLSLSLEENHTLISLPALFLTSGLARRILTKLLSQLTPKAHNNLLCQQTHSNACARATNSRARTHKQHTNRLPHTHTHTHTHTQFDLNTQREREAHTNTHRQSEDRHVPAHTHARRRTHTHTLIDRAVECGCRRRRTFIRARGSNVERKEMQTK